MDDRLTKSKFKSLKVENNNLSKEQCLGFVKLYEDSKGNLTNIINPITKKKISDLKRIRFIYENCLNKIDTYDVYNNVLLSKKKLKEDYIKISTNLKVSDIYLILENNFNDLEKKDDIKHILKKINVDKTVLSKYLETHNDKIAILFRYYKKNICAVIDGFDPFLPKKDFEESYLHTFQNTKNFENIVKRIPYYFIKAIMYSNKNTNKKDFLKNLKKYSVVYYSLNFMLKSFISFNINVGKDISEEIEIIDRLLLKKIDVKGNSSMSFLYSDTSSGYSKSPQENNSKYPSYIEKKDSIIQRIMDNTGYAGDINEIDFYTQETWREMPLKKLLYVIKIPYTLNGKTYCNAYYSKSLYKAWNVSIKDKKPFINPITKIEFLEKDEASILENMRSMYIHIKKPTIHNQRGDLVSFRKSLIIDGINVDCFTVSYKIINDPRNRGLENTFIELLNIYVDNIFSQGDIVEFEYTTGILFDNLEELLRKDKLLGKNIPFKIHPIIEKYNRVIIRKKRHYVELFNTVSII